jgi:hypothetical protein
MNGSSIGAPLADRLSVTMRWYRLRGPGMPLGNVGGNRWPRAVVLPVLPALRNVGGLSWNLRALGSV